MHLNQVDKRKAPVKIRKKKPSNLGIGSRLGRPVIHTHHKFINLNFSKCLDPI